MGINKAMKQKRKNISKNKRTYLYRIDRKVFPQGDKVVLGITKFNTNKITYISALDLFKKDKLLKKFSPDDIRDIVYAAAWEMFIYEKKIKSKIELYNIL